MSLLQHEKLWYIYWIFQFHEYKFSLNTNEQFSHTHIFFLIITILIVISNNIFDSLNIKNICCMIHHGTMDSWGQCWSHNSYNNNNTMWMNIVQESNIHVTSTLKGFLWNNRHRNCDTQLISIAFVSVGWSLKWQPFFFFFLCVNVCQTFYKNNSQHNCEAEKYL